MKVEDVLAATMPAMGAFKSVMAQKFEVELPMAMSGLDVPSARIIGKRLFDDLCERFQAIFEKMKI